MRVTYTVVLREEPEGTYTVLVPALPEIVTHGRTIAEAKRMAEDAIVCCVLGLQDLGEPVPTEGEIVVLPEDEYTGDLHICRVSAVVAPEVANVA